MSLGYVDPKDFQRIINAFPQNPLNPYKKAILFQSRFGQEGSIAGTLAGFGNDGVGSSMLDTMLPFSGAPTMRLVTSSTAKTAGAVPSAIDQTPQNITKRRINSFGRNLGRWWIGFWWWPSWFNDAANDAFIFEIYNRDGTNRKQSMLWCDTGTPALQVLTGFAPTWQLVDNYDWGASGSSFNNSWSSNSGAGGGGIGGNWHYLELGVDHTASKYLYAILNEKYYDLSAIAIPAGADGSAKVLHFTFMVQRINNIAGQNWCSVADPVGGIILG